LHRIEKIIKVWSRLVKERRVLFIFVDIHILDAFYLSQLHDNDNDKADNAYPEENERLIDRIAVVRGRGKDLDLLIRAEKCPCMNEEKNADEKDPVDHVYP